MNKFCRLFIIYIVRACACVCVYYIITVSAYFMKCTHTRMGILTVRFVFSCAQLKICVYLSCTTFLALPMKVPCFTIKIKCSEFLCKLLKTLKSYEKLSFWLISWTFYHYFNCFISVCLYICIKLSCSIFYSVLNMWTHQHFV